MRDGLNGLPRLSELSLAALDLDGTVICSQGKSPISQRCLDAVARCQAAGLPVTFVTGRTEDYALPIAKRFGVTTPLVTYNGARIYSPAEQRVLYKATISEDIIARLLAWLDEQPDVVALYAETPLGLRLIQNRCSGSEATDDYLFGTPREIVGRFAPAWQNEHELSKAIVVTRQEMDRELQQIFADQIHVVRTHPDLFEILPSGVDKGSGVLRLCQELAIDPQRVLTIGDQHNDVATFQAVGYSVAMGDAPEGVRAAATWTTVNFEDEGCARVLEALI